jgi:hypothetical protein
MFRFSTPACNRTVVSVVGLEVDDVLELWREACPSDCPGETPGMYIPFSPAGCAATVTQMTNPLMVDVPGVYELRFQGAVNPNVKVCVQDYNSQCPSA